MAPRNGRNGNGNGHGSAARTVAARARAPAFPVAYVRYHDHCWLEADELEKIRRAGPFVVEETGFLLVESPTYVTLAKERSTDGEKGKIRYGDVTIIMKSDILDFRVLGTPPAPTTSRAPRRRAASRKRP